MITAIDQSIGYTKVGRGMYRVEQTEHAGCHFRCMKNNLSAEDGLAISKPSRTSKITNNMIKHMAFMFFKRLEGPGTAFIRGQYLQN